MTRMRVDPVDLGLRQYAHGFELVLHEDLIITSIGAHPVRHEAKFLLRHMIDEYLKYPVLTISNGRIEEPRFLGAYALLGLQREFIDARIDNLSENFPLELASDPVLNRLAGPEQRDIRARHGHLEEWLRSEELRLVDLDLVDMSTVAGSDPLIRTTSQQGSDDTRDFHRLSDRLHQLFDALAPEERAAVVFLHNAHQGSLVHAIALMLGRCTPKAYAAGVGAAHLLVAAFADVTDEDHSDAFSELEADAVAAVNYVAAYRKGTVAGRLRDLLQDGAEGTGVEFKSTLRFDLKQQTNNREVTEAVLKTIAAFLNTQGGTLLIGVADDKSVVGIAQDGFDSDDEFLRHLHTVVGNAMGRWVAPLVASSVVPMPNGDRVCIVDCVPSPRPVMCAFKTVSDAFFVRTGPATVNLVGEERAHFQRLQWGSTD